MAKLCGIPKLLIRFNAAHLNFAYPACVSALPARLLYKLNCACDAWHLGRRHHLTRIANMPYSVLLRHWIGYGLAAALPVVLCSFSIYFGELPLTSYREPGVTVMSGVALWLMIPAMLSGCLAFLSMVLAHYDRRGNEERYRLFLT